MEQTRESGGHKVPVKLGAFIGGNIGESGWLAHPLKPSGPTHLLGLQTFRTTRYFKIDPFTFGKGLETRPFDGGVVYEHIFLAIFRCNEPKSLAVIEPLYCTNRHFTPQNNQK